LIKITHHNKPYATACTHNNVSTPYDEF
jgi:hypothetical protein